MGERGPIGQTATLHLIKGNPSKLPAARLNDALRPQVGIPDRPDFLLPDAKAEWDRITPELKRLHIISNIDMAALAMYCQAYALWAQAQRKLKELGADSMVDATPSGYNQISAWYVASAKAFEQMRSMLAEFGLSPLTRARISANVCVNTDLFNDIDDPSQAVEDSKPQHGPSRFFKN